MEALLFCCSHQKLYNLFVIIDYNKLQGFGSTKEILNLSSLKKRSLILIGTFWN